MGRTGLEQLGVLEWDDCLQYGRFETMIRSTKPFCQTLLHVSMKKPSLVNCSRFEVQSFPFSSHSRSTSLKSLHDRQDCGHFPMQC